MRTKNLTEREKLLESCFDCFSKNGLEGTSTKMLAEACGMSSGNIFHYFATKDEIIIRSTAHCMAKVEDDFMANAPQNAADIRRFLQEVPYCGIPWQVIRPLIYVFVRACVHYALFEDEEYLKPQIALIEEMLPMIAEKYAAK